MVYGINCLLHLCCINISDVIYLIFKISYIYVGQKSTQINETILSIQFIILEYKYREADNQIFSFSFHK
jgi:hypothetical protein